MKEIIHNEEKFKDVGEMLTTWEEKAMGKGFEGMVCEGVMRNA